MAGSISLSMSQQFDENGSPLSGGLLYFIQAGTTSTPQNAYQDSALTLALPNPITLDAAGRVPQFYLADGTIKIRLTDSAGVQQLVADNILVVGPSSGSGGGGSVDATTILETGDIKVRYGTGALSGFVRANGRTMGSATSGATERANADTQALFEYLWGADANLSVSGGRGASANADWTANKTITLPDWRGRVIGGLDDMGNTAAGRLTTVTFSGATTLGASGGTQAVTLTAAQLPPITPTFTGTLVTIESTSTAASFVSAGNIVGINVSVGSAAQAMGGAGLGFVNSTASYRPSGTIDSFGSGDPHSNMQPTMLATIYLKL